LFFFCFTDNSRPYWVTKSRPFMAKSRPYAVTKSRPYTCSDKISSLAKPRPYLLMILHSWLTFAHTGGRKPRRWRSLAPIKQYNRVLGEISPIFKQHNLVPGKISPISNNTISSLTKPRPHLLMILRPRWKLAHIGGRKPRPWRNLAYTKQYNRVLGEISPLSNNLISSLAKPRPAFTDDTASLAKVRPYWRTKTSSLAKSRPYQTI
jgi:hypothetical protein